MRIERRALVMALLLSVPLAAASLQQTTTRPFTVEQILGFPSPENLVASAV